MKRVIFFLCALLALCATAQQRPIRSTYGLELGRAHLYSSYLSPLTYTGLDLTLSGSWRKQMRFDPRWEMEFRGSLDFADAKSPAKNSSMLSLLAGFSWGMERVWRPAERWSIGAGGAAELTGGLLYLARNSNNPVAARASADLALRLSGTYDMTLLRRSFRIYDRMSLPSLSVFFSPEYGETYFEIWLGNRHGLANLGWWGNHFCFDNLLACDWKVSSRRWLTLGWRFNLRSSYVHHLNTQTWRHAALIALTF